MRIFSLLLLMILLTSCDKFSLTKSKNIQPLDTVVNFTAVDTYPSFKNCDAIIDKVEKQNCFRNTIHTKIGEELLKHTFTLQDSVNETVLVNLIIDKNGVINFESLQSSKKIQEQLPLLDSLVEASVKSLEKIYPAIKRGIPVTTKYQLPIKIKLEN